MDRKLTRYDLIELIDSNQDVRFVDTSEIKDFRYLFMGNKYFNQDISNWNTSNAITMKGMFENTILFNFNISSWNTSKVKDMSYMFFNAKSYNQSLNGLDTSNVITMMSMFSNTKSFNKNFDNLNLKKLNNISNMFSNSESFNQSISFIKDSEIEEKRGFLFNAKNFNQSISLLVNSIDDYITIGRPDNSFYSVLFLLDLFKEKEKIDRILLELNFKDTYEGHFIYLLQNDSKIELMKYNKKMTYYFIYEESTKKMIKITRVLGKLIENLNKNN